MRQDIKFQLGDSFYNNHHQQQQEQVQQQQQQHHSSGSQPPTPSPLEASHQAFTYPHTISDTNDHYRTEV
jgi:hypothetical protein